MKDLLDVYVCVCASVCVHMVSVCICMCGGEVITLRPMFYSDSIRISGGVTYMLKNERFSSVLQIRLFY